MTPTMQTLIHSARLVTSGRVIDDGWVLFDGDTIASVGTGTTYPEETRQGKPVPEEARQGKPVPEEARQGRLEGLERLERLEGSTSPSRTTIDAHGRWLTPGFIDIHGHGGGGSAFDGGPDAIHTALALHRGHGTTRSVLSLVTASLPDLERQLESIAEAARVDPLILGAHLEGPFLDDGHRGAHDRTLLRAADTGSVERMLAAASGTLVQVTLAPELPGAMEALHQFCGAGVVVAVGHCGAGYDEAKAAFDAGATILTHAFNAMPGIHHRRPGPVAAAMDSPGVTLELINDGVHVHPAAVRLAFAGAAGRIAFVTDAMAAAGAGDGDYLLGTLRVSVVDGVARLGHHGTIAGSTLTQDVALRLAVTSVGLPMEAAVQAITQTPARAIGRESDLGQLAKGFAADAVLLNADLSVDAVWAAGRRLT